MPVSMRPLIKSNEEVPDAERLRQIARRKEQNRNAQRRLRERKEEYTMQLEAQLAELHRRSQSQEEESHFLREALARMRAENQTLAEQIVLIHQAVPSTQTSHPLPQRASIDLGIDPFAHTAPLNRNRNRSQSATASSMPHFLGPAPWATTSQQSLPVMHHPFGSTIVPGATHRPFPAPSPMTGSSALPGGLSMAQSDTMEDVAMPRSEEDSRRSSLSLASQRRDSSLMTPFDSRGNLSRHGSGQTELTLPSEHSDTEGNSSSKTQRASISSHNLAAPIPPVDQSDVAKAAVTSLPPTSDEVMASCLESIHSMPMADAGVNKQTDMRASHKPHFDSSAAWMSSAGEIPGQLALPDFRQTDLSTMSKPLGLTPGALGLTNAMSGTGVGSDGWSISPWISLTQTPSAGGHAAEDSTSSHTHDNSQNLEIGMAFDSRKSLASRRGFSGSLKFESRAS